MVIYILYYGIIEVFGREVKQVTSFQVADTQMILYSGCAQMDGESAKPMTIGEAVHGVSVCLKPFNAH